MLKFNIDTKYLCSIPKKETSILAGIECIFHSSVDHPEFLKIRTLLELASFIQVEPRWHNGDIVLKAFKLNDKTFEPGEQFSGASAMKYALE